METLQIEIINPKALKLLRDLAELDLISIKKTPAKPEIASYKTKHLKFNGTNYILREKLESMVSFAENQYMITNELLDISVWGDTRQKAEDAFAFTFHSLYQNFAKEDDTNLTNRAKVLKGLLKHLVVKITND